MKPARLAPLLVVALVGCSPSPTVAAQVGDTTITTARVADIVAACPAVGTTQVTDSLALQTLIHAEIFREVADITSIKLDDKELRSILLADENFGPFLTQEPDCTDLLLAQAASTVLGAKGEPAQLDAALAQVQVEVNPRYGTWSTEKLGIEGSGSLSTPVTQG
ncbi:hypothetical protein [Tessaracoccus antarcticus]|uniref:Lipoprotein n=1 Tax=Tessaracoccus antarcticus TaxID=2479848 RepID=A0A3M0GAZ2_9ACTN|nr:hypothetical protein [Tessaracoccus antarcticus]RMB62185.1 hypothetical protein EAX62_06365 [Tessaracoccus antarcticus]